VAVVFAQGTNYLTDKYIVQGGYEPPVWHPLMGFVDLDQSIMPFVFAGIVLVISDGIFVDLLNALRAELTALRNAQFISAVRAKGASVVGHITRNMVVPVVSAFASRLPMVVGAVVIVEYVFTIEGAGYVLLEASKARDFPVVVGVSVLFTAMIIAVNIASDILGALVDPREVSRGG
jgi:peptide/nickel transport system permease protein